MKRVTKKLNHMYRKGWKRRLSHRMKTNNPMWDPAVADKISESMKGNQNARKFFGKGVEDSAQAGKSPKIVVHTGHRATKTKVRE